MFGKKEGKEKAEKKRGGLFRGKSAKAESEGNESPNAPGIRRGMEIPGAPAGFEPSKQMGTPGSLERGSKKEKEKKGFLGFGKKKETKPPIVPMVSAASMAPVAPAAPVTPVAFGDNASKIPVPCPTPEYRQKPPSQ